MSGSTENCREREAYLDERIVAYNRLRLLWGEVRVSKNDLGVSGGSPAEALALVMERTSEEERRVGLEYAQALKTRVEAILADPTLKAEFEARIAAVNP